MSATRVRRRLRLTIGVCAVIMVGSSAVVAAASTSDPGAPDSGGHARAEAEAKVIIKSAPVLPGSKRSNAAPDHVLRQPPQYPSEDGLVKLARFWTIKESAGTAFTALTAKTPSGFANGGRGSGGGPGYSFSYAVDNPNHLPTGIAYGALLIAVAPLKHGLTGIGVYAEAAPQPPRPADEDVPTSVSSVAMSWTLSSEDRHALTRTVTGAEATALVSAFDGLKVSTVGETACPADFGELQTATFVGDGHTWVASVGNCGFVGVVRDGQALRDLSLDSAFYRQVNRALGLNAPKRPVAEKVPAQVHSVRLRQTGGSAIRSRTVTGNLAGVLVSSFDQLAPLRSGVLSCDTTTGATTTLTFRDSAHAWKTVEDPCGLLAVTRDGTSLPTVVAEGPWDQFIAQALRHH